MLCLLCDTNPRWIESALSNINSILIDHAHCEKKAVATGLSILSNYPEKTEISLAMSDLVEEEIGHYRSVVNIIKSRNLSLIKDKGDNYARELLQSINKNEPKRLLDRLLTAGIIEARSFERLMLLGDNLNESKLKKFYTELASSEAGHYVTYTKLAKLYFNEDEVKNRLDELTEIERKIVISLPNKPTIHG